MFRLPYIPRAEELIDNAFRAGRRRAKMARSTGKRREVRMKQSDFKRIEMASKIIDNSLKAVVKNFPTFEKLSPFHQTLLDIKVDRNKYKKSLGAVNWCMDKISALKRDELAAIRHNTSTGKEFLGRASSYIKRIEKDLEFLIEVKEALRSFPALEDVPTLVVAGFPNVGKSTFVKSLTGSKIEIKPYPFTTKEIMIGHLEIRHIRYQIVDSPGLLERLMEDRNKIELQAILALKYLANKILFMVDPTQELEPQLRLLDEISNLFKVELHVAVNKVDIASPEKIEDAEKRLAPRMVFRLCANNLEDCLAVFKGIYGK